MKAMIFAAGRGERMRPLTDELPKPLLPLAGKPLIVHSILACRRAGIREIVINVSYKAEAIMKALGDGSQWDVQIQYSPEGEPALETAGGIIRALPLLGEEPFIALSGDIVCPYDLSQLIARAPQVKLAHLVMVPNPAFKAQGDFGLTDTGYLSSSAEPKLTYGNIGVFHPALFNGLPVQRLGLGELLRRHLGEGELTGECYRGDWFNIGTPDQLTHAEQCFKESE